MSKQPSRARSERYRIREMELEHEAAMQREKEIVELLKVLAQNPDFPYVAMIVGGGLMAFVGGLIDSTVPASEAESRNAGERVDTITLFGMKVGTKKSKPYDPKNPPLSYGSGDGLKELQKIITSSLDTSPLPNGNIFKADTTISDSVSLPRIVADAMQVGGLGLSGIGLMILVLKYLNLGGIIQGFGGGAAGAAMMAV